MFQRWIAIVLYVHFALRLIFDNDDLKQYFPKFRDKTPDQLRASEEVSNVRLNRHFLLATMCYAYPCQVEMSRGDRQRLEIANGQNTPQFGDPWDVQIDCAHGLGEFLRPQTKYCHFGPPRFRKGFDAASTTQFINAHSQFATGGGLNGGWTQ